MMGTIMKTKTKDRSAEEIIENLSREDLRAIQNKLLTDTDYLPNLLTKICNSIHRIEDRLDALIYMEREVGVKACPFKDGL